jgi:hypothetical protein
MKGLLALLALVLLVSCASHYGRWVWRHPDGSYNSKQLWDDIYQCEEYRKTVEDKGPSNLFSDARDYGGWGDFQFEFCMNQRNWFLKYEPIGPQGKSP